MSTKRLTVWALGAAAIVLAAQLLTRRPPSDQPLVDSPLQPEFDIAANEAGVPQPREPRAVPPPREQVPRAERVPEPAGADALGTPLDASDSPPAARDGSRRFMFDCGNGVTFAVRVVPGEATLVSPQALGAEVIRLPQVDAGLGAGGRATQGAVAEASGSRYAGNGASFSRQGGLATFEIRERTFADCTSNPGAAQTAEARRRGATFRAHGNAPAWLLEITSDNIELALERDARRLEFPYRAPTVAGTRTTYRSFVGTQELVVVIDELRCNDSASGEQFESTVTVTFEGTTLYGCGRAP